MPFLFFGTFLYFNMKNTVKIVTVILLILAAGLYGDAERYRMYNYQALMDLESERLESLISGGSTNNSLTAYRSFLLKGNYALDCHRQRFLELQKEKRALDSRQVDAYATLSHRFQVKYQPFYEEFFVKMHTRLRQDPATDYFSVFVSMDSLWTVYEKQLDEQNQSYVKDIEGLKTELKQLDADDRAFREFLGKNSGRMLKRSRELSDALAKYRKKTGNGISVEKAEINVGTLTWNLEHFGEYAACDYEDSLAKLFLETDLLLKQMGH